MGSKKPVMIDGVETWKDKQGEMTSVAVGANKIRFIHTGKISWEKDLPFFPNARYWRAAPSKFAAIGKKWLVVFWVGEHEKGGHNNVLKTQLFKRTGEREASISRVENNGQVIYHPGRGKKGSMIFLEYPYGVYGYKNVARRGQPLLRTLEVEFDQLTYKQRKFVPIPPKLRSQYQEEWDDVGYIQGAFVEEDGEILIEAQPMARDSRAEPPRHLWYRAPLFGKKK